ncbi:OmpW/AlkL family protein [Microbulbifer sp. SSSA002]|uniref:OmpW/AlkL family protein n=1 Tax=unclassified Microbulbifer TaxID=2619833 RepID=UPI0040398DC0
MKMTRILIPVMTPLALAISSVASAGPAGYAPPPPAKTQEFKVRIGGAYVSPNSDNVTFADRWLTGPDEFIEDWGAFRTNIDPSDEWGWFINAEWRATDHMSVSLSYTQGDRHTGGDRRPWLYRFNPEFRNQYSRDDFARWKPHLTALYLNYYPLDPSCLVQPYIGAGINYADFTDERLRNWGWYDDDFEFVPWERGRVNLNDSWGYTWQVGVDFNFGHDSSWLVNLAAIYYSVDTDVEVNTLWYDSDNDNELYRHRFGGDYLFDPWSFNIGVGYKFNFHW